jgi:hypothetical protein
MIVMTQSYCVVQWSHEKFIVVDVGIGSLVKKHLNKIGTRILNCFEERRLTTSIDRIDDNITVCDES